MVSMWRGVTALGCALPFFLSGHVGISASVALLGASGVLALGLFFGYCGLGPKQKSEEDPAYAPILEG